MGSVEINWYVLVGLPLLMASLMIVADGNPDEQKIGAFGVGSPFRHCWVVVDITDVPDRILQRIFCNRCTIGQIWGPTDAILLA